MLALDLFADYLCSLSVLQKKNAESHYHRLVFIPRVLRKPEDREVKLRHMA